MSDAYVVKIDDLGDPIWSRTYGVPDGVSCIRQTLEGGYVFAGWGVQLEATPYGDYDYLMWDVVKTDSNGDTLWARELSFALWEDYCANWVAECSNGGYITAGGCYYSTGFALLKFDSAGVNEWNRWYGGGLAWGVIAVGDGFVVGGDKQEDWHYDFLLIKTNSDGDTLWTRTYGGVGNEEAYSLAQTNDGGYVLAGYTDSYGAGGKDFYVVRTDGEGNVLWTKTLGGTGDDVCRSIQQTTDGGYILAGYTTSFGSGNNDWWIIKLEADTVGVREEPGSISKIPSAFRLNGSYPNPFNLATTIFYEVPVRGQVNVHIYNILGQEVATVVDGVVNPGHYAVTLGGEGNAVGDLFLQDGSAGVSEDTESSATEISRK